MKMKVGPLKVFGGTNWKLAGPSKWTDHPCTYLANGNEKYVGNRMIGESEYCVFKLCTDDFGAQLKSFLEEAAEVRPNDSDGL